MQRYLGHRRVPQRDRHVVIVIVIVVVIVPTGDWTDTVHRMLGRGESGEIQGVGVVQSLGEIVHAELRVIQGMSVGRGRSGGCLMAVHRSLLRRMNHRVVYVDPASTVTTRDAYRTALVVVLVLLVLMMAGVMMVMMVAAVQRARARLIVIVVMPGAR